MFTSKSSTQTFHEMNENWKKRIVEECEHLHEAIEVLRQLAQIANDERLAAEVKLPGELTKLAKEENFLQKIDILHSHYCDIANTVTLRLLLNGALELIECQDESKPPAEKLGAQKTGQGAEASSSK